MTLAPTYLSTDTADTIYGRLSRRLRRAGFPLNDGSPEAMLTRSYAEELYLVGIVAAAQLYGAVFIATAYDPDLDKHGQHYAGGERLPATRATTQITFGGVDGTIIPSGTRVSTAAAVGAAAVPFVTLATVAIGDVVSGSATVDAQAAAAGAAGNVGAGSLRFLSAPLAGVATITNAAEATGGSDVESLLDYRARLLRLAARTPGMANVSAYEAILDTLPGVGFRLVEPHWSGLGTLRAVFLNDDGSIPDGAEVAAVQLALDPPGLAGLGEGDGSTSHFITVVAPTPVNLTLAVPGLVPEAGVTLSQAKDALALAAAAYLATTNPGGAVVIRDLEAVIIQAEGVANIADITLNGVRADVVLATTQKAVLSAITYP